VSTFDKFVLLIAIVSTLGLIYSIIWPRPVRQNPFRDRTMKALMSISDEKAPEWDWASDGTPEWMARNIRNGRDIERKDAADRIENLSKMLRESLEAYNVIYEQVKHFPKDDEGKLILPNPEIDRTKEGA